MFLRNDQTTLACLLALFLTTPAWANDATEYANDWGCDKSGSSYYPRNFIGEFSDEVLEDKPFTEAEIKMSMDGEGHNALDRLLLRDDFSERWFEWLDEQGLPREWRCGEPRAAGSFDLSHFPAVNLITYQFLKATENLGNERLFCKHLFKYRSPRVNQDTTLRASFLKLQCLRSLCSFVFFPKESDDVKHYLDQYEHTNALLVT